MTKRRSNSRKEERAEAAKASAPSLPLPAGAREWRFNQNTGYSFPVVSTDEARCILTRGLADKSHTGDAALIDGIAARVGEYPDDIGAAYSELMFATIERLSGPDFFARMAARAAEPEPPSASEIAAQSAQDIVHSAAAIAHVLAGQRNFQKASGKPKQSAICRELIRRGFTVEQLVTAGYNRQTAFDARTFCRAEKIRSGQPLPPNMEIRAGSARRGGDDRRIGRGPVADENREASRLVAMAAPVLVKPSRKAQRKGVEQKTIAFDRQSFSGEYDEGRDEE